VAPTPRQREDHIPLGPHQVEVWRASLGTTAEELRRARELLTPQERDRADRYRNGTDAARFVMRRGFLRLLLSRYLGRPGRQIALQVNAYGKPGLLAVSPPSGLHFSLSHSQDAALFAFAHGRKVGIDVERIGADITGPLRAIAGDEVAAGIPPLPDDVRRRLGYRCWVRAEACLKATGAGLPGAASLSMQGNAAERMSGEIVRTLDGEMRVWDLGRGRVHAAALAVEGAEAATVSVMRLLFPPIR
jgi:4'-phosphopantetheinyl transferase